MSPPGLNPTTAEAGVCLNGFHLFQIPDFRKRLTPLVRDRVVSGDQDNRYVMSSFLGPARSPLTGSRTLKVEHRKQREASAQGCHLAARRIWNVG